MLCKKYVIFDGYDYPHKLFTVTRLRSNQEYKRKSVVKIQKFKNTRFSFQDLALVGMETRVESDWVLERRDGLLNGCERDLVKVDRT